MKHQTIALRVLAGFGSGCQQPVPVIATSNPGISANPLATEAAKPKPLLIPMQSSQQLSPNATTPSDAQLIAVIKRDPGTGKPTGEMELRLQKGVEEVKRDERALLRVESFVSAGGSPGFDLSLQRDPTRHWVGIHLIRTGAASTPAPTGTIK